METASGEDDRAQPTEAEIREYMQRLRTVQVEQVVGETVFSLLNAAQAKLGRRDARLLIDLATVSVEHVRAHVSAEFTGQVDDVLGQLRLAQVNAEGQRSSGEAEENDLDRMPAPPAAADPSGPPSTPSTPATPSTPPAASRLWVPGQR